MVYAPDANLKKHGINFLFAGTQKDDPIKLHVAIKFPNIQAVQAFRDDEELTKRRAKAGAVTESSVVVPILDEFFTNYPDSYMKH